MIKIGCHLSSAKGFLHMAEEAVKIKADCFQFFTRNPRGGKARKLDRQDIEKYLSYAGEHHIANPLAHAPYTLNPCARDKDLRQFAYDIMCDDLARLEYIPGSCYNFHPGSHVRQGEETGIRLTADLLNRLREHDFSTTILLETMAGKGSEIGRNFEQLRRIIDMTEESSRLGVCLDTCHVFDGGYDIADRLEEVLQEFDEVIGLDRLRAIHLNDSRNPLGSHKDRHEKIGQGSIGLEAFARIVRHEKLCKLPFYLETPNDLDGYAREIALLRQLAE